MPHHAYHLLSLGENVSVMPRNSYIPHIFHSKASRNFAIRITLPYDLSDFRLFLHAKDSLDIGGERASMERSFHNQLEDTGMTRKSEKEQHAITTMTFLLRGGEGRAIVRNQYIRDKERVTLSKFPANIYVSRFALFTTHRLNAHVPRKRNGVANDGILMDLGGDSISTRANDVSFERDDSPAIM